MLRAVYLKTTAPARRFAIKLRGSCGNKLILALLPVFVPVPAGWSACKGPFQLPAANLSGLCLELQPVVKWPQS